MRNIEELKSPSQSNLSSEKLLSVLETMSELEEPIRLQELSRKLGMNSSTVLRFLTTLQKKEYVAQEVETDRYYLTFKICALADNILTHGNLRTIALPVMKQISRIFGETVSLLSDNDMSAVYLESVNVSESSLKCLKQVGTIEPLHCTAAGKLLLLEYDDMKLSYLYRMKGLTEQTENTLIGKRALLGELEKVREAGHAYDNEEFEYGVRSVAVPVFDHTGKIAAALAVTGPVNRMTDQHIASHLGALESFAYQVSTRMGYTSG